MSSNDLIAFNVVDTLIESQKEDDAVDYALDNGMGLE